MTENTFPIYVTSHFAFRLNIKFRIIMFIIGICVYLTRRIHFCCRQFLIGRPVIVLIEAHIITILQTGTNLTFIGNLILVLVTDTAYLIHLHATLQKSCHNLGLAGTCFVASFYKLNNL